MAQQTRSSEPGDYALVDNQGITAAGPLIWIVGTQVTAMAHIEIEHIPFALSMLPFFALGIAFPATIQDWVHGRLMRGDGLALLGGLLFVRVWEWAILFSISSKKRQGQGRLLGRPLSSWYWAPPITFAVGVVSGLIFIPA